MKNLRPVFTVALSGFQSGSFCSAFHLSQSAFSSRTFSGIVADRSFASLMSSFRLMSRGLFSSTSEATSFQSPLRIAHCSPNRQ